MAKWVESNSFGYRLVIGGVPMFVGIFPSPALAGDMKPMSIWILYYSDQILLGFNPAELSQRILEYSSPLARSLVELIRSKE